MIANFIVYVVFAFCGQPTGQPLSSPNRPPTSERQSDQPPNRPKKKCTSQAMLGNAPANQASHQPSNAPAKQETHRPNKKRARGCFTLMNEKHGRHPPETIAVARLANASGEKWHLQNQASFQEITDKQHSEKRRCGNHPAEIQITTT